MSRLLFWLSAFLLGAGLRAETTIAVPTDTRSNITIKLTSPANSVPHFGFLPVRVSIENIAARDGEWTFRFETGYPGQFPGPASSTYEIAVPVAQTSEFWLYVPMAEPGVVPTPPGTLVSSTAWRSVTATAATAVAAARAKAGGLSAFATPGTPGYVDPIVLARQRFQASGFDVVGITPSYSLQATGTTVRVMIQQTGLPAMLPAVDLKRLPPDFSGGMVTPAPGSAGTVRRFFIFTPPAPPVSGGVGPGGPSGPMNPVLAEAEARRLVNEAGLFNVPPSVRLSTIPTRTSLPITSGLPTATAFAFVQTGPAAVLRLPAAGSLPPAVTVTLHPAEVAGEINRVIVVVDPEVANLLRAAIAARPTVPSSELNSLVRLELIKLGYLRTQPGTTGSSSSTRPGPDGTATFQVFSDSGPANLLPPLTSAQLSTLPPGVTSNVTPGALPGEVVRNFVVDLNQFSAYARSSPATTTTSAATAGAGGGRGGPRPAVVRLPPQQPTQLTVAVSGPGIVNGVARVGFPTLAPSALPPLAVARDLEAPIRAAIAAARVSGALSLAPVDPAQLPADWRLWSSFNGLAMNADDFAALDGGRRSTLRGWVAMGGRLILFPAAIGEARTEEIGAGRIDTLAAPLDRIESQDLLTILALDKLTPALPSRDTLSFASDTPLARMMEFIAPNILWIGIFLVIFAVLIGPVNLYFLAPVGARHRLFFTTPLISVVGAIVVAVAIVLQDGVGGEGRRRALVVLVPGENQAAVFQEQAARTGFLFGRNYTLDENVLQAALPIDASQLVAFLPSPGSLSRDRREVTGEWFRNRARQAQMLRTLAPTRARVERVDTAPGGAPIVESTLATELKDFWLRDDQGAYWTTDSVPPGRRVTLKRGDIDNHQRVYDGNGTGNFGALIDATGLRGAWQWTAQGGAIDIAPINTLGSIRWGEDEVLYAGVAERPAIASSRSAAPARAVEKGGQ